MSVAVTAFGSTPVLSFSRPRALEPEDRLMVAGGTQGRSRSDPVSAEYRRARRDDGATLSAARDWTMRSVCPVAGGKWRFRQSLRTNGAGVLNETAKRAMPELSQFLLDHGASLDSQGSRGFYSADASCTFDGSLRRIATEWCNGCSRRASIPTSTNDRGDTAYQLGCARGDRLHSGSAGEGRRKGSQGRTAKARRGCSHRASGGEKDPPAA